MTLKAILMFVIAWLSKRSLYPVGVACRDPGLAAVVGRPREHGFRQPPPTPGWRGQSQPREGLRSMTELRQILRKDMRDMLCLELVGLCADQPEHQPP